MTRTRSREIRRNIWWNEDSSNSSTEVGACMMRLRPSGKLWWIKPREVISSCSRISVPKRIREVRSVRAFVFEFSLQWSVLLYLGYAIDRHDTHLYHKKISRKATLKRTLKYYENSTRASRSNTGTIDGQLSWDRTLVSSLSRVLQKA